MNKYENERPVSSGLDEVFSIQNDRSEHDRGEKENVRLSDGDQGERNDRNENGEGKKNRHSRPRRRNRSKKHRDSRAAETSVEHESTEMLEDADGPDASLLEEESVIEEPSAEISVGEYELTTSAPQTVKVVGVRFKDAGKVYYFDPGEIALKKGDHAIVETSRGVEYGYVSLGNTFVPASEIVPPLRPVIRAATADDAVRYEENLRREKDAFGICLDKIRDHQLEMKLIDAEYTFDQSKLTFYFSADGRVDFRELVKDLAAVFRTRIELRQIGIRDEAKLIGGLGVCGRPFCCTTFLGDFTQVSIKMAKEQNLSLNSAKISGACGRLMCCLRFEHDVYEEEIKKTPPCGSKVKTAEGIGTVVETSPLRGKIKVRIGDDQNYTVREYDRTAVTVLPKN